MSFLKIVFTLLCFTTTGFTKATTIREELTVGEQE